MVKDFKNDTWEMFYESLKCKKLYIWGAGQKGKEIVENFASKWTIEGFIDSNNLLEECLGYTVFHPKSFHEEPGRCCIMISTNRPGSIACQISQMGITDYYSYYYLNMKEKRYLLQEDIDQEKIEIVKSLLSDEKSRLLLDQIVEKRKRGFLDYTDIKEDGDEYFDHDFFSYHEDEVLVDGGGYDGDTIEEFASFTKNRYKQIYSFEPDQCTGERLESKLYRYGNKVKFYPYGLYSEGTSLPFCNDNQIHSSHIVNDDTASSTIQCVKLDDIIGNNAVTFIKMDIEGAEIPALYGARNTIFGNKPKLAICIYHKPDDLWEIPLLIHSWISEYKLYIRHYGVGYRGTILFATL